MKNTSQNADYAKESAEDARYAGIPVPMEKPSTVELVSTLSWVNRWAMMKCAITTSRPSLLSLVLCALISGVISSRYGMSEDILFIAILIALYSLEVWTGYRIRLELAKDWESGALMANSAMVGSVERNSTHSSMECQSGERTTMEMKKSPSGRQPVRELGWMPATSSALQAASLYSMSQSPRPCALDSREDLSSGELVRLALLQNQTSDGEFCDMCGQRIHG